MLPKHEKRRGNLSLCTKLYAILDDPPSPYQLRTYLIDDPFLNQETYKDIRISYSMKYKHSKK